MEPEQLVVIVILWPLLDSARICMIHQLPSLTGSLLIMAPSTSRAFVMPLASNEFYSLFTEPRHDDG